MSPADYFDVDILAGNASLRGDVSLRGDGSEASRSIHVAEAVRGGAAAAAATNGSRRKDEKKSKDKRAAEVF